MVVSDLDFPNWDEKTGERSVCPQVFEVFGGPFSAGNWMTQNPFLFWDPIFHWGGSEWRSRSGFHFRRKYTLCDKSCTLDEFHIDEHNPMYDPLGHATNDIPKAFGLGQ